MAIGSGTDVAKETGHVILIRDDILDVVAAVQVARLPRDARVEIKEYEDLEVADTTVHAFYVRFLLPIWFDVQVIERAPGSPGAPS